MSTTSVILTAGFNRAKHVLALADWLHRDGISVSGILIVSPYTRKRLSSLYRQRGKQFLFHAVPRLVGFKRKGQSEVVPDHLDELISRKGLATGSLKKWARENDVPVRSVVSLNDKAALLMVQSISPSFVVYGGGGILGDAFIKAAEGRILNAHSGPLPQIRGMNACEWSLLLGYQPTVTIHFIDRGIDTGALVSSHPVEVEEGDTVETLRSKCVATGVSALHDAIVGDPVIPLCGTPDPQHHRQCFVLAPALLELLEARLDSMPR